MLFFPNMNQTELTPLEASAVRLHEIYISLLQAGFSSDEALSLIAKMTKRGEQRRYMKDKLMWVITLGILAFIGLVVLGEYTAMLSAQWTTGEAVGTNPDAINLVQNALVGLIGIIGGYFAGKDKKE